jgi:quercetin dioxygenase-like cupin family protein
VKRHPVLVPFSHDHHRALVEARRLRRAAGAPAAASAAAAFLRFFAEETVPHFHEEEELLFPSMVEFDEARTLLVQALLEHQRLHARAAQLHQLLATGGDASPIMRELGRLLEAHVRTEERQLFPLIERLLNDAGDDEPGVADRDQVDVAGRARSSGRARGIASEELNATLVSWGAGSGPPEHVNEDRDVVVVVLDGSATVRIDDEEQALARGETVIVANGRKRKITAGSDGVRYVSVHRRRPLLQIGVPRRQKAHTRKTEGVGCCERKTAERATTVESSASRSRFGSRRSLG